jgi:hypothetical protein
MTLPDLNVSRDMIARFVGRDQVDDAISSDSGVRPAEIEFVLVLVDDSDLARIPDLVRRAIEVALRYDAVVLGMDASLILLACGLFRDSDENHQTVRRELVAALHSDMAQDAVILHGTALGMSGTIGASSRFSWTVLLPGFKKLLGRLSTMEFGEMAEV